MSCSFDNTEATETLEEQLNNYCLSLVSDGMSSIQNGQILFNTNELGLIEFEDSICSDITYIGTIGNIVTYSYEDILIRILVLRNGL